jgi:hypothetical protein
MREFVVRHRAVIVVLIGLSAAFSGISMFQAGEAYAELRWAAGEGARAVSEALGG